MRIREIIAEAGWSSNDEPFSGYQNKKSGHHRALPQIHVADAEPWSNAAFVDMFPEAPGGLPEEDFQSMISPDMPTDPRLAGVANDNAIVPTHHPGFRVVR